MSYKVVSQIKTGSKDEGFEYLDRGESVTKAKLGVSQEEFDELVADGVVMESKQFDATFPELVTGENQPSGTPSNLAQVEGTTLQQNPPEVEEEEPVKAVNPADPPVVKGADDEDGSSFKDKDDK